MNIRFQVYEIAEFGFFKFRASEKVFGDISTILGDIEDWAKDLTIQDSTSMSNCLCKNYHKQYFVGSVDLKNGDKLFMMWNENDTDEDGNMLALKGDATDRTVSVSQTQPRVGEIPGSPTYYWLSPKNDRVIAISLHKLRYIGMSAFCRFVTAFMLEHSPYVVIEKEKDGKETIVGHSESAEKKGTVAKRRAVFRVARGARTGEYAFIKENVDQITELRRKLKSVYREENPGLFRKSLFSLFQLPPSKIVQTIESNVSLRTGITADELNTLYNTWKSESSDEEQDDYGFVINGKAHWFGKDLSSVVYRKQGIKTNRGIVELGELKRYLDPRIEDILRDCTGE